MLRRFLQKLPVLLFLLQLFGDDAAPAADVSAPARVLQFSRGDDQLCSAIVLSTTEIPDGVTAHDHIVLVDTSASQVGAHRQQGLAVVESLLNELPQADRVLLFAVDLQAEPLSGDWQCPHSAGARDALEALRSRVPLGATHLEGALRTALQSASDRLTDVVYIGDGMSTADLIEIPELQSLVTELQRRRIPVHSFAIGAQKNLQLLGILALQTGGSIAFDSELDLRIARSAARTSPITTAVSPAAMGADQGRSLAAAVQAPIFFPTDLRIAPDGLHLFPATALPLRPDRETIYVYRGKLPATARLELSDHQTGTTLKWKMAAPVEQRTARFLPLLADQLERDHGLTNPLAGMTLFQLAQVGFLEQIDALAQAGQFAAQRGDIQAAARISDLIAQTDPDNPVVDLLHGDRLQVHPASLAQAPEPADSGLEERVPPNPQASLLDDQRQMIRVLTEKLRNDVSNTIDAARNSSDPEAGLGALKQSLGAVKSAIDIAPEDRLRLQKQLESEIQLQQGLSEQRQQQQTRALERRAQEESIARLAEQTLLDEERLENLIDRVRALILEGRHGRDEAYAEAQEVADVAINMRPGEGASAAARFDSEAAQQLNRAYRLRARRADQLLETLHQVELSHIPFPDEPPIRFPPAEVWKALSERRKQQAVVDLKRSTPNEKRIQKALQETTEVSFNETPLEDALKYLEDLHHIEIWVDKQALQDEGVTSDLQVSLEITGITLRSALRLLLEPSALTYLIEDEVMKITTKAKADEKMSTRVYPVADLVIPIRPPMGMGMGMMGGMGGMSGGMGGMGMGGMGMGGMGGMGMGMGMGMFSVPAEPLDVPVPQR